MALRLTITDGTNLTLNTSPVRITVGASGAQGPAGQGVPTGGTTGQVLAKNSATNYDTEWVDQTGGGGSGGTYAVNAAIEDNNLIGVDPTVPSVALTGAKLFLIGSTDPADDGVWVGTSDGVTPSLLTFADPQPADQQLVTATFRIHNDKQSPEYPSPIQQLGNFVYLYTTDDPAVCIADSTQLDVRDRTGEPTGIVNKDLSTLSFNNSTRTLTISPTGTFFEVFVKGRSFEVTSGVLTIPNVTGLYYVFFEIDSQQISFGYQTTYFDFGNQAPVAYVYWNATTGKAEFFADERHGVTLDWQTHEYLHRTRGAAMANGFGLSGYTTTGTGANAADAQAGLAGGTFFDEDLEVQVVASTTPTANTWEQNLAFPMQVPVFWLSGTAWQADTATTYPLKQGAGAARAQYNLLTGSTWSAAEAGNSDYVVSWIVATNNLNSPVIAILGQASYGSLNAARNALWEDLTLTNFPIVEFRPLHKLIFQTATSYTNAPSARLRDVQDIRGMISIGSGTTTSDHGLLNGLADDDHTQYALADGTRGSFAATTHASQHGTAGADPVSLDASQIVTGTVATARLGTGTASAATYLRGNQTYGTPPTVATDALWDAAGDLAVGTGADTAARLAKGTRTQALVVGASTLEWDENHYNGGNFVTATVTGAIAETIPGGAGHGATTGGATGVVHLHGIYLPKGVTITTISFVSGAQAAVTPTNQWFALCNSSRTVLRVTTNDTTTAWAASTVKPLNLTSTYTTTYSGLHYLACCVTAGTVPSFRGANVGTTTGVAQQSFTSTTGQTTPVAEGTTFAASTGRLSQALGIVS